MTSAVEEKGDNEEAYSPSGSLTPPITDSSFMDKNSSKQPLPSTLQNMLASITKKSDESKSIDLKSDPIVQAYKTSDEAYSPEDENNDQDDNAESKTPPLSPTQSSVKSTKVNRDPRQRPSHLSLSQLTDDEVIKKASEMGFMNPENPEPIPDILKTRTSEDTSNIGSEQYDPFAAEEERPMPPPPMFHPPSMQQMYGNQPFPPNQIPFNPDFPPPPPMPPNFLPQNQFQPPMYPGPQVPPLPPLPPSQIPFTNPQPPPPPPPPPVPVAPLPPPLPEDEPLSFKPRKKKSKKEKSRKSHKKGKRKHSESPPPRSYDSDDSKHDYDKSRDRDRYSSKRREKRDSWRTFDDRRDVHEKRRDSWEYDAPPPSLSPPPQIPGPPPHQFVMHGPMRGGPMRGGPMRGRFPRGMRGGFRGRGGFDHGRGFHRGRFLPRGVHHMGMGPPPNHGPGPGPCIEPEPTPGPGPSRNFTPKNIHIEYEEDIRRFEEQRLKQKNLDRRKWRTDSPPARRRRGKDSDSD